jgi:esterase
MPTTRVNGVRLAYDERGEGAPILCIHGGGSTAAFWSDAARVLAGHGRVITYDRRGCGRSERPENYVSTSPAEQAADAAALLDALGATPAIVIARSYGGEVALELALRHRGKVRALALLEGDALGVSERSLEWTRDIRAELREVAERDGMDAVYPALIDRVVASGIWATFPPHVREILIANGPALLAELAYVDQEHAGPEELTTIDVPVLLVAAADSPPEQVEMAEALADILPDTRFAVVEGGHLIDPSTPAVLEFVTEVLAS